MEGMCMYGGCDENDVDPRGQRTEKGKKGKRESKKERMRRRNTPNEMLKLLTVGCLVSSMVRWFIYLRASWLRLWVLDRGSEKSIAREGG